MTWNKAGTRLKVTTYPMVHIGDQSYYDRVAADLGRCRHALLEGVSWRLGDAKRPLYDLVAKNLGMAAQEQALRIPPSVTRLNVDMGRSEFRARLLSLPLRYFIVFILLRRVLWLVTLIPALRHKVVRYGILGRSWHRPREHESPLLRLIGGSRDRRIAENLTTFLRDHGQSEEPAYVGVVFGAAHMPAISAALRQLGFQVGTRRWIEVLRVSGT